MIRSNLPRSIAVIVAAILWQLVLPHASRAADAPRPNVVFVITDDQRWDAMGCAGHPFIKTPNMDRIAREGAMFTNAFVTTPPVPTAQTSSAARAQTAVSSTPATGKVARVQRAPSQWSAKGSGVGEVR